MSAWPRHRAPGPDTESERVLGSVERTPGQTQRPPGPDTESAGSRHGECSRHRERRAPTQSARETQSAT